MSQPIREVRHCNIENALRKPWAINEALRPRGGGAAIANRGRLKDRLSAAPILRLPVAASLVFLTEIFYGKCPAQNTAQINSFILAPVDFFLFLFFYSLHPL